MLFSFSINVKWDTKDNSSQRTLQLEIITDLSLYFLVRVLVQGCALNIVNLQKLSAYCGQALGIYYLHQQTLKILKYSFGYMNKIILSSILIKLSLKLSNREQDDGSILTWHKTPKNENLAISIDEKIITLSNLIRAISVV